MKVLARSSVLVLVVACVSVSGAGDVNGDGSDDLIAAAPLDDNNGTDSGSARVFSGVLGESKRGRTFLVARNVHLYTDGRGCRRNKNSENFAAVRQGRSRSHSTGPPSVTARRAESRSAGRCPRCGR